MRPTGSAEARARIEQDGDESVLTVDLAEADSGERINFARLTGRIAGPDGSSHEVVLQQEGPGRYVGRFASDLPGSYIVGLRYAAPATDSRARTEGTIQAAVTKPFTDEFRALEDNAGLLRQIAERTGGRVLNPDASQANLWLRDGLKEPVSRQPIYLAVMLAAIALFLIDVAIRRVRLDLGVLASVWHKLFLHSPERETASMRSLREVRAKAQAKMRPKDVSETARNLAKRKFEADPDAKAEPIELGAGQGAPLDVKPTKTAPPPASDDEEGGISRLLRAKQRAKDEMDQSE